MKTTTSTLLRIYRGPDDDGPDKMPPAAAQQAAPWWLGRTHLSVGEFMSAFNPTDINPGTLGTALRLHAKKIGRDVEAVRGHPSATFPTGVNRWPLDLLIDYFDGKLIGGILIEAAWLKTAKPEPTRAAA